MSDGRGPAVSVAKSLGLQIDRRRLSDLFCRPSYFISMMGYNSSPSAWFFVLGQHFEYVLSS